MSKTATAPPAYDDPSLDVDIIRAYEDKDHDDIIELVGGGVMEHLNHANNRRELWGLWSGGVVGAWVGEVVRGSLTNGCLVCYDCIG